MYKYLIQYLNRAIHDAKNAIHEIIANSKKTTLPTKSNNTIILTDRNGIVLWLNSEFTALTGYPTKVLLKNSLINYLYGHSFSESSNSSSRNLSKLIDFEDKVTIYGIKGNEILIYVKATLVKFPNSDNYYVWVLNELKKRNSFDKTDKFNYEDMNTLFEIGLDGVVVFDKNRVVIHINNSFQELLEQSDSNLIGINEIEFDNFMHQLCINKNEYIPSSRPGILCDTKLKNDKRFRFEIKTKTTIKTIERLIIDSSQIRINRVVYFKDVTNEIIVEKMKTEFVATAAHELRTPMTIISGYSELLRITPQGIEMQKYMIETIYKQSKCMIELLNDILDVARIESRTANIYNMKVQQIGPLLINLAKTFITPENKNLINLSITNALPEIYVDATKIERAIKNCLSNAYKYSPNNSIVNMIISKTTNENNSEILISIQDHGIGMTPEQVKHISEKFYRANPYGDISGTGLGMSITKEIIEKHGGYIDVQSELGVGTNVTIHLPVVNNQELIAI
jgi:signal transduction histidine kinase